ncbi:MAG TPA: DUF1015 domain-containing protein, partial [Kofleriaceae bacterium]|nr:DUF1015 domain-containing protein [Kofleriaceae bacterium]
EERFGGPGAERTRRGFFAAVRLHPWEDRVVLPHERTRPKPKADRRELLHTCRTQFSPIFSLFEDPTGEIGEVLARAARTQPIACAQVPPGTSAEVAASHLLWRMDDSLAERLSELLAPRPLFIADGHHRYETALDYRDERRQALAICDPNAPYELTLMLLVSANDPGLIVLPTHRLVAMPEHAGAADLLHGWRREFEIEREPIPPGAGAGVWLATETGHRGCDSRCFAVVGLEPGMVHWLRLRQTPAEWPHPPTWRDLDVGLLEALIVEPLKRRFPETQVEFTRDANEAVRHAAGPARFSVLLNPTTVDQVLAVAQAGDRMPEKSTYFWPKVATGMVMYPLE